jgi:hypothetical protein
VVVEKTSLDAFSLQRLATWGEDMIGSKIQGKLTVPFVEL